jgi:hypothetical protein
MLLKTMAIKLNWIEASLPEYVFPYTVLEHVLPCVAAVPVSDNANAVHEATHEPVIVVPYVDDHEYSFL